MTQFSRSVPSLVHRDNVSYNGTTRTVTKKPLQKTETLNPYNVSIQGPAEEKPKIGTGRHNFYLKIFGDRSSGSLLVSTKFNHQLIPPKN